MTKKEINIREYVEEKTVKIDKNENGRIVVNAYNEGGFCRTEVDLMDILEWAWVNIPYEVLKAREAIK